MSILVSDKSKSGFIDIKEESDDLVIDHERIRVCIVVKPGNTTQWQCEACFEL